MYAARRVFQRRTYFEIGKWRVGILPGFESRCY
jgi:hypothetical protein